MGNPRHHKGHALSPMLWIAGSAHPFRCQKSKRKRHLVVTETASLFWHLPRAARRRDRCIFNHLMCVTQRQFCGSTSEVIALVAGAFKVVGYLWQHIGTQAPEISVIFLNFLGVGEGKKGEQSNDNLEGFFPLNNLHPMWDLSSFSSLHVSLIVLMVNKDIFYLFCVLCSGLCLKNWIVYGLSVQNWSLWKKCVSFLENS